MGFNIKEYIKSIEEKIFKGYKLKIFKGYKASNKTGAQKVIDDIYSNLDADVENARKQIGK